jgi:hypothetical protein
MKMLFAIAYTANLVNADGAPRRTGVTLTAAPHSPQPLGRKRRF